MGGGATPDGVKVLYGKTCTRMQEGGFKLRKWLTNDDSVRAKIQTASVVKEIEVVLAHAIGEQGSKGIRFSVGF